MNWPIVIFAKHDSLSLPDALCVFVRIVLLYILSLMSRRFTSAFRASRLSRLPWPRLALIATLLVFTAFVLSLLKQKALMVDETIHTPAGYSYVVTNDFR